MAEFIKFQYTKFGLWDSDEIYQIYKDKDPIFWCLSKNVEIKI